MIQTLSSILTAYLPSIQIMSAIGDPLDDLLEAYSRLVREEGTYLSKAETLRYFISTKAIPLLVVSLNQSLLKHRIADMALDTPEDKFWYLPTVTEDGSLVLPLEKVMRWVYARCDLSQTKFHYPGKNPRSDNRTLQQNLDNAIKRTRGPRLTCECGACKQVIGNETSEQLEIIPMQVRVTSTSTSSTRAKRTKPHRSPPTNRS